jgi:Zn-dependent protease
MPGRSIRIARIVGIPVGVSPLWLIVVGLDGGRVARALMWHRSGDIVAATNRAAGLGRAFGYLLIGAGMLLALKSATPTIASRKLATSETVIATPLRYAPLP